MSAAAWWLTYLVLLPASSWLLGSLLSLRDTPDSAAALYRIARAGLPFLAMALLLGTAAALPALAALVTAVALHVAWSAGLPLAMRRGWLSNDRDEA